MSINFDDFKVRCSQISIALANSKSNPVLTENQSKILKELESKDKLTENMQLQLAELLVKKENSTKIILSDGYISYLCSEYSYITTGKIAVDKEFLSLDQMDKGNIVQEEAIATLCLADDVLYTPNDEKERVSNEFLTGEVDCYLGESIMTATVIPDVKSVWDYPTFLRKTQEELSLANSFQIKGYQDITGAKQGFVADVLINTPQQVLLILKSKLLYKLGCATDESHEFVRKWAIIERSMIFDDIPIPQRVNKKYVEPFTEFEKQKLYDKVKYGRDWLWKFHEKRISIT